MVPSVGFIPSVYRWRLFLLTEGTAFTKMIKRENNSVALPIHILDDRRLTLSEIGLLANIYRWGDKGYNDETITEQIIDMCHLLPEWCFAVKGLIKNGYMDNSHITKEDMDLINECENWFIGDWDE